MLMLGSQDSCHKTLPPHTDRRIILNRNMQIVVNRYESRINRPADSTSRRPNFDRHGSLFHNKKRISSARILIRAYIARAEDKQYRERKNVQLLSERGVKKTLRIIRRAQKGRSRVHIVRRQNEQELTPKEHLSKL
jgi:hypothetical protein